MLTADCTDSPYDDPIDSRVVQSISERFPLDKKYVEFVSSCHGGEPQNATVKVGDRTVSVAKFLTLLDNKSELTKPFRPHFDHLNTDERVINGIDYLLNWEHSTSNGLFSNLVPFAGTKTCTCYDRCDIDLFCFDYRANVKPVGVVLWHALEALDHLAYRDQLSHRERFDSDGKEVNVDWDSFLTPVAPSFEVFTELICSSI